MLNNEGNPHEQDPHPPGGTGYPDDGFPGLGEPGHVHDACAFHYRTGDDGVILFAYDCCPDFDHGSCDQHHLCYYEPVAIDESAGGYGPPPDLIDLFGLRRLDAADFVDELRDILTHHDVRVEHGSERLVHSLAAHLARKCVGLPDPHPSAGAHPAGDPAAGHGISDDAPGAGGNVLAAHGWTGDHTQPPTPLSQPALDAYYRISAESGKPISLPRRDLFRIMSELKRIREIFS